MPPLTWFHLLLYNGHSVCYKSSFLIGDILQNYHSLGPVSNTVDSQSYYKFSRYNLVDLGQQGSGGQLQPWQLVTAFFWGSHPIFSRNYNLSLLHRWDVDVRLTYCHVPLLHRRNDEALLLQKLFCLSILASKILECWILASPLNLLSNVSNKHRSLLGDYNPS